MLSFYLYNEEYLFNNTNTCKIHSKSIIFELILRFSFSLKVIFVNIGEHTFLCCIFCLENPFILQGGIIEMKRNLLADYAYPDVRTIFTLFESKHNHVLANHVIRRFLSYYPNYVLFTAAICFPTKENWGNLDQAFRQFYIEIRFIHYIAKVIRRYAKDFRMKSQRYNAHYLSILDQPVYKEESSIITYKDQLEDEEKGVIIRERNLLGQVEDCRLLEALKKLTDKQLWMMNSYFVEFITQREIACCLDVSQQFVSKRIKTTLDRLKYLYEKGG